VTKAFWLEQVRSEGLEPPASQIRRSVQPARPVRRNPEQQVRERVRPGRGLPASAAASAIGQWSDLLADARRRLSGFGDLAAEGFEGDGVRLGGAAISQPGAARDPPGHGGTGHVSIAGLACCRPGHRSWLTCYRGRKGETKAFT
jgi:hypothetical protein